MANAPDSPANPSQQHTPANESTPLLPGSAGIDGAPTGATAGPSVTEAQGARLPRDVAIASWVLFAVSTTTLLLGAVLGIMCAAAPLHFSVSIEMQRPLAILELITLVSLLLSGVNLLGVSRLRPCNETGPPSFRPFTNLVVNIALAAAIVSVTGSFTDSFTWYTPECVEPNTQCREFLAVFMVVLYMLALSACILGWIIHPALTIFWLKTKVSQLRTGPGSWSLPAGQLSFEVSIKFVRQDPLGDREAA